MVLGVCLLSIFVDLKDLLPDVAMMNLSGTPYFESQCMSPSPNGLYRRRPADKLSLQLLEDCKALRASNSPNLPSQPYFPSLLDLSVTVTLGCSCLFSCMIFRRTRVFLSASASQSVLFFFFLSCRPCMCQLPGRQKVILSAAVGKGGKRDTAPAATGNGPSLRMPARELPIKMYA